VATAISDCSDLKLTPKTIYFPVFSLMIREFETETGSQLTAPSTMESADCRDSLGPLRGSIPSFVRLTVSGTHLGVGRLPVNGGLLVGVAPTGKHYSVQHIHWFTLRDGLIIESAIGEILWANFASDQTPARPGICQRRRRF